MRSGKTLTRTATLWGIAALGAVAIAACGDDETSSKDTRDVPLFESDGTFPDVTTPDVSDTGTRPDVPDARDSSPQDLIPDTVPPTVVSTTPAAGANGVALPLTITIVFSEPVYAPTIATQSIKLYDWLDNEIPGAPTLGPDGKTVTWRPTTNNQVLASKYTIRVVANFVSDLAGNRITSNLDFSFTTANYPNQDAYQTLAAKYAPTIYSAVADDLNAQMQVPTKFDTDNDWNLGNNRQFITLGATQLIPAVYFVVSETYTHYYITYVLYWPYIKLEPPETTSLSHTNGASGVLVVVEKARGANAERPIAAYTYWREQVREENFAFVTTESDIVPGSDSAGSWSAKAEQDQATLFPDGRVQLYVTAGYHRMCIKGWNESGIGSTCPWGAPQENMDKLVFKYLGGSPTTVVKKNNAWPSTMADVDGAPEAFGYALIPLWSTLWLHRTDTGDDAVFDGEATPFKYKPDADRPGANFELPGKFVELLKADLSSYGRAPWAWQWDPASSGPNDLIDQISNGQITIDPSHYVWERHHRVAKPNGLNDYVAGTGEGFSRTYCFNGFVSADVRATDPKCAAPQ